ncbi:MAG: hypothetical protein JOZ66_03755 [Hyphomicrobiales bacterium]|nr:hypothetical protein [Hyphomicrobiales bacterium]
MVGVARIGAFEGFQQEVEANVAHMRECERPGGQSPLLKAIAGFEQFPSEM